MNNGRNYRDSLVNIFSVERSSQESRGFSHERFKDKIKVKNGIPVYNYYVSEKGKNLLYKIFSQYKNINIFKKAS